MAKITFITSDDETITLEGTSGSVMALAVDNGIKGIDGDCGGYVRVLLVTYMFYQNMFQKREPLAKLKRIC